MKCWPVFPIFMILCSCTTVEFVRKDLTPVKQGILRHSPPANAEKEKKYRDAVNKEAEAFCGGKFEITKEYQAIDEARTTASVGTGLGLGMGTHSSLFVGNSIPNRTMYSFVEFVCIN